MRCRAQDVEAADALTERLCDPGGMRPLLIAEIGDKAASSGHDQA